MKTTAVLSLIAGVAILLSVSDEESLFQVDTC
jgi:hypothetical protein